jgi:hypothetical protein
MGFIAALLGRSATDDTVVNTIGQRLIYDAVNEYFRVANEEMTIAYSVFIERETEEYKFRYKLPGNGRLARRSGQTSSPNVKQYGEIDVALPLEEFGKQVAGTVRDIAYLTLAEIEASMTTVQQQNINTVRWEILHRLFDNVVTTFGDERKGDLTIQPLANGDSVVYPPVEGSETEATENHYLESGYAAANISDTNNPYLTIRPELDQHFGGRTTGNANLVVFHNSAQSAKIEALTNFYQIPDGYIRTGQDTDVPQGLPTVPGAILGRCDGCWCVEWNWVPANYMLAVHLEVEKPLQMRRDPAYTGLTPGLQMVSENDNYPLQQYHYSHAFGLGVINRLNGVAFELGVGGSYTIPADYD